MKNKYIAYKSFHSCSINLMLTALTYTSDSTKPRTYIINFMFLFATHCPPHCVSAKMPARLAVCVCVCQLQRASSTRGRTKQDLPRYYMCSLQSACTCTAYYLTLELSASHKHMVNILHANSSQQSVFIGHAAATAVHIRLIVFY